MSPSTTAPAPFATLRTVRRLIAMSRFAMLLEVGRARDENHEDAEAEDDEGVGHWENLVAVRSVGPFKPSPLWGGLGGGAFSAAAAGENARKGFFSAADAAGPPPTSPTRGEASSTRAMLCSTPSVFPSTSLFQNRRTRKPCDSKNRVRPSSRSTAEACWPPSTSMTSFAEWLAKSA